ncbi:hypothetical protein T06_8715 [Trichinella sp. T6]|nr:hypothetical protein T06_8715 [Trichinella sp. T6]
MKKSSQLFLFLKKMEMKIGNLFLEENMPQTTNCFNFNYIFKKCQSIQTKSTHYDSKTLLIS